MNLVKIISSEISKLNQRVVKYLRFGNNDVQTSIEAMAYGTDSMPVKDMVAVYAQTEEKGKTVIVGYLNVNQISAIGEHRIFSTDADGLLSTYIHLKNDGTMDVGGATDNMVRFSILESAYNQLKSDHDDLVAAFNTHVHATAAVGTPSPPTPATGIPATDSTGDITNAKIDEIKTI